MDDDIYHSVVFASRRLSREEQKKHWLSEQENDKQLAILKLSVQSKQGESYLSGYIISEDKINVYYIAKCTSMMIHNVSW